MSLRLSQKECVVSGFGKRYSGGYGFEDDDIWPFFYDGPNNACKMMTMQLYYLVPR